MSHNPQNTATVTEIADVQGSPDARRIAIDRVGIKDIRHPVTVRDRSGEPQPTVARFNMYVNLAHHQKGTHMSRFVAVLSERDHEISVPAMMPMLDGMIDRLEAQDGHLEVGFSFFRKKAAPVSRVESLLDYDVLLTASRRGDVDQTRLKVVVPVTSLCPCSKEISRYGAHNQRSHVTVTARCHGDIWIEEIIDMVEAQASAELYGLLKRPDEKHVTEQAYDNPKFVEDMVRDVAGCLDREPRVLGYVVESENFESIHNHSAYAYIDRDESNP